MMPTGPQLSASVSALAVAAAAAGSSWWQHTAEIQRLTASAD